MATRSRTRASRRVTVTVTDALGGRIPSGGLGRWLANAAPRRARGAVAVALVSDRTIRRLNAEFRGHDEVTDVLSFPGDASGRRSPGVPSRQNPREAKHLGNIAIALGRAARQAREYRHPLRTELRVLALHGLLHLLGYDHERDRGEMHAIESRLRRCHSLPHGLIGRASIRPSRR
jgi:probable rRNA maturation factor